MAFENPSDDTLRDILATTRTIAVVGASANRERPVYGVMKYLLAASYALLPVNPRYVEGGILGKRTFARLADIPEPVDVVDVFRRQEALAGVVDEALALDPKPGTIWMQLGLRDDDAAARAAAAGVTVVMDRCIMIEHRRLGIPER